MYTEINGRRRYATDASSAHSYNLTRRLMRLNCICPSWSVVIKDRHMNWGGHHRGRGVDMLEQDILGLC
ncbi:hypothetical protein Scep_007707 [Stephania cephalantha]|uniref:Uncharacterized protein n=1 Tax=Stephania cephalantha TaxID=152367 RepID=A0AAP0KD14_9MAGN